MPRRVLALLLLLSALAVILTVLWPRGRTLGAGRALEIPRQQRSALIVTFDTTRADHIEPYGAENVATPTFARLATEGLLFERAYAVAPITLVAHTSILSGIYPPRHGVRNNGIHYVADEVETLAERLGEHGLRTAAFVSAAVLERRYNLDQGFEVYDDDLSAGRERHPRMVPDRPAEATVDAARRWLDGLGEDERFFLWVHFYDPHAVYSPPPPYRDDYREDLYSGEIAYADAQLGRLLAHPRLAESVVAVLADHGESLGEHGEQTHALLAYDATLRIPFVLRIPGGPRGVRVRRPVSQVDLAPTLLDLLEVEAFESEGISLARALESASWPQRGLYGETYLPYYTYGWAKLRAWINDNYKLIDAPTAELYDLRRDPRELSNRHDLEPGVSHDLERELAAFLVAAGDADRETDLAVDEAALESLRALGYVSVGSGRAAKADGELPDPKDMVGLHTGLERARVLMRDRLWNEALRWLESVLERDPNNLAALIDLANTQGAQGELDAAVRTVEHALALDPAYARLHLMLARFELRRNDLERATELVDGALELEPLMVEGAILRARLQLRQGEAEAARATLDTALERLPQDANLNAHYAQLVEIRNGDLAAAATRLEATLAREPFLALGWRLLGETRELEKRPDDALGAYREGLRRQPDDGELHGRLGLLLAKRGGGTETEVHLREALRLAEEPDPELRVALGAWLAERARLAEAIREYDAVLAAHPRHPRARNNRAIALHRSGQTALARSELEQLIVEQPRLADPHNNLAAIAVDNGDWPSAERHAHAAIDRNDEMAPAWNNLGVATDELGRHQEAERALSRALELDPDYWPAQLNLAIALEHLKRPADAADLLQNLLRERPEVADAHYRLGELYAGPLDDPARARIHLNAFLSSAPNHPSAAEARRRIAALP